MHILDSEDLLHSDLDPEQECESQTDLKNAGQDVIMTKMVILDMLHADLVTCASRIQLF